MELHGNRQEHIARLAICVVLALVLYYGGERLCAAGKLPLWERYGPWLEENRIRAIAVVAAILFGVSLALFPPEKPSSTLEEPDPCEEAGDPF